MTVAGRIDIKAPELRKVLLVDDDSSLLRLLTIRLKCEGYDVETAHDGRRALAIFPSFRPHVVVTDVCMKGMDGLKLFEEIQSREPTLPVLMLTGHGTIPDAVNATQRGVYAYLTKPCDKEMLVKTIERAWSIYGDESGLVTRNEEWREGIITQSTKMENLFREAWMVARSEASVLIRGESGTGKELLAQAIHRASRRKDEALVPVNCTAIPTELFEAELFGHVKGAFTGATHSKNGLIQAANNGTLLLDEIGDMPLAFQAKLLRMLQEREIRPVGSACSHSVDVRVISATHQDLENSIETGAFREDLYYRLNVVTLEIPGLAERREDIPLLAEHFLHRACSKQQTRCVDVCRFSRDALELMLAASWPGNVRQLRNVVDHCVALATTTVIPAPLVERALRSRDKVFLPFVRARDRFELTYLTRLLEMTGGNVAQAARLAERNRTEFYKLLHKHELEPDQFRRGASSKRCT